MAMSQMVKLEELMDPEKRGMKDFLLQMPREDVLALSKTSAPLIIVKNVEEAIDTILKYSDGNSMLHRQKVTKKVLATYLDKKGLSVPMSNPKAKLVQSVISYWTRAFSGPVRNRPVESSPLSALKADKKDDKSLLNAKREFHSIDYYFNPSASASSTSTKKSKASSVNSPLPSTSAVRVAQDKYIDESTITSRAKVDQASNNASDNVKFSEAAPKLSVFHPPRDTPSPVLPGDAVKSTNENVTPTQTAFNSVLKADIPQINNETPKLSPENGPLVATVSLSSSTSVVPFVKKPEMVDSCMQTELSDLQERSLEQRIYAFIENKILEREMAMKRYGPDMMSLQLGQGWCAWWFERVNSLTDFGPQHFFIEATIRIEYIQSGISKFHEILWNGSNAAAHMSGFRSHIGASFFPNLVPIESGGGLQIKMSPHGLAEIMVAGTIHDDDILRQGSSRTKDSAKGIFEQVFGIMQDPTENGRYKVKYTILRVQDQLTLVLKSKDKDSEDDSSKTYLDIDDLSVSHELITLEDFD